MLYSTLNRRDLIISLFYFNYWDLSYKYTTCIPCRNDVETFYTSSSSQLPYRMEVQMNIFVIGFNKKISEKVFLLW